MHGKGTEAEGKPILNEDGDMLGNKPRNVEPNNLKKDSQTGSLDYRVRAYVYASHFLSAWGDRMWQFGVGMFMVIIAPDSLRLTATYGLCMGTAVLLFGAHVGNMVDKVPRISAARWTLIIQNVSVAVCAAIIYFVIIYKPQIETFWPDEGLLNLCYAGIILVAIVSSLASTGNTIAVERDWIAEICGKNEDMLASMSATLKGIDLTTNIVAPIATGQIMAYGGVDVGAIFIGAWNVVSVFVEYYLLWKVYSSIPALRVSKDKRQTVEAAPTVNEAPLPEHNADNVATVLARSLQMSHSIEPENRPKQTENGQAISTATTDSDTCTSCLRGLFSGVTILVRGWRTFMKYDVAFAGLALSTLYMTVLGFDNITVGYAYTQGVNESIMGILMAAGAAVGILGTIIFPRMRRCFGLVRTGLLGLFLQISISSLCVVSIWAPGSPFDPLYRNRKTPENHNNSSFDNITTIAGTSVSSTNDSAPNSSSIEPVVSDQTADVSIIIMLAGIVGSRCGLWITDLTITQLFLMRVHETERGVVLGVQTSLNQLMDMLKFVIVIVAPEPEVFGILVLISFGFICSGWLLYAKYARSVRGHLFHFDKILTLCGNKYVRIPDTLAFKK